MKHIIGKVYNIDKATINSLIEQLEASNKKLVDVLQECHNHGVMSKALVCQFLEVPLIDFDLHFKREVE
jgi:hypothetical protein